MKTTAFWIHHLLRFDGLDAEVPITPVNLSSAWHALSHRLSRWMFDGDEPKVWKKINRSGVTIWHVYDPVSNMHATFDSESEIRSWLEKRYNEPTKEFEFAVQR